jgi:hypothetical protein
LIFTEIKDANVYIFWGTRDDPVEIIKDGESAAVGSPITLPIGGQIVVVSETKRNKLNSSLNFNFALDVVNSPWWDKMGNVYFWLMNVGIIIALISLLSGCYGGFCCCFRPCKKVEQGKIFNDPHFDADPNAVTAYDVDQDLDSESEGTDGKLYGYGKPMGGRGSKDGDVYINDDTDIFANGHGVEEKPYS